MDITVQRVLLKVAEFPKRPPPHRPATGALPACLLAVVAIDLKIAKLCRKLWLESAPNLPNLPEGSERFPPVLQAWTWPRLPFLPQPGLRFGRGNWACGHQSKLAAGDGWNCLRDCERVLSRTGCRTL
jgi:hypothetical protein